MKRYIRFFESVNREQQIYRAIDWAKAIPTTNRKAFSFMLYLVDADFECEDIITLAIEHFKLHRSVAEAIYKQVEHVK